MTQEDLKRINSINKKIEELKKDEREFQNIIKNVVSNQSVSIRLKYYYAGDSYTEGNTPVIEIQLIKELMLKKLQMIRKELQELKNQFDSITIL